jgi:hypothetical protein
MDLIYIPRDLSVDSLISFEHTLQDFPGGLFLLIESLGKRG